MEKSSYNVIGLMSGTSLDGLDMAYCQFNKVGSKWEYSLLHAESLDYDVEWQNTLKNAINLTDEELDSLDNYYGKWLGAKTSRFIQEYSLSVDLIASHGHTVFHQPADGITLQIGSGQEIANTTNKMVICDFRKLDVSLNGQGAPLVPIGDELLFGQYLACVNLGGIANISFMVGNNRVAFDIGMANMQLNYIVNQRGHRFDEAGMLARSGSVDMELLNQLNDLEYYHLPYPKSIGYEWFLLEVKPIVDGSSVSVEDKLATSVEHEAQQLGMVMTQNLIGPGEILITGGGAFNEYLVERIKYYTPDKIKILVPDKPLVEFKEAIVFALMGVLRLRNEDNCLKSVTGASRNSSGGVVFEPEL